MFMMLRSTLKGNASWCPETKRVWSARNLLKNKRLTSNIIQ